MIVLLEGLWDVALSQNLKLVMGVAELDDKKKKVPNAVVRTIDCFKGAHLWPYSSNNK